MEAFKCLMKYEMRALSEADNYASKYKEYKEDSDRTLSDMYYMMAEAHLEIYNKLKPILASHLNKIRREKNDSSLGELYNMMKELVENIEDDVREKLR